jgi:hypothetical protein
VFEGRLLDPDGRFWGILAAAMDIVPALSLVARTIAGDLDRSIGVGPRCATMPLSYEHAARGPGSSHPVGLAPKARKLVGRGGDRDRTVNAARSVTAKDAQPFVPGSTALDGREHESRPPP